MKLSDQEIPTGYRRVFGPGETITGTDLYHPYGKEPVAFSEAWPKAVGRSFNDDGSLTACLPEGPLEHRWQILREITNETPPH